MAIGAKSVFLSFAELFSAMIVVLTLTSCGGGGGGSSPSAPTVSYTFSPATLTTSVMPGASATLSVRATVSDPKVFAGASALYVFIVDPLKLLTGTANLSQVDASSISLTVYTSAILDPGRYQGSFQIQLCKDAACAAQFTGSPLSLPYDLTVTHFPISLSASSIATGSMQLGGTPPADIGFNVIAQAQSWTATSPAAWLRINNGSGNGNGTFTVSFVPSGLAVGKYTDAVTLTAADGQKASVPVSLSVDTPTLSSSSSVVTLGGSKGRAWTAQSVQLALNTGSNTWPWNLSGLPAWLSASPTSGVVGQSATQLNLTPVASQVTPGSVTATVNVNADVGGTKLTLPVAVQMNADQRKLLASSWGVGLSSTPAGSALTRTLTIRDNFGGSIPWTAVSDSSWLQLTPTGTTPSAMLTLTANPAGLPDKTISYANVTISTGVVGIAPAVVRVGLWKDSSQASASTFFPTSYKNIAADTIRPYVYASNGGTTIDIYNAHTASLVRTLTGVGSAVGAMSVSPDGSTLYAIDTALGKISIIDLTTMTSRSPWTLSLAAYSNTSVLAARPNGQEVVLVGNGTAYSNGASLGNTGIGGSMAVTSDASGVYTQNQGLSPASVAAFDLDYSAISGGTLMVTPRASGWNINGSSNGADVAVSPDGTRLYTATGAPYVCSAINPKDLALIGSLPGGDAYPNNVEVTQDGRVICGINGMYTTYDFWVHSPSNALIKAYKVVGYARGLVAGQLVVTPDSFIVVTLTDDPRIAFVPIGP